MKAWHFVREDRKLMDGNSVAPGYVYEVEPPISLCNWGLHASVKPLNALRYAPGPIACRVELSGEILKDTDKVVATRREVIWMADAGKTLRRFACWCVRNTPLRDGRKVWDLLTDERSRLAVEVAEMFLEGKATAEELAAAWAAAWAAAGAAAWDAATDAQNKQLSKMLSRLERRAG